jgi:hypothetical protein
MSNKFLSGRVPQELHDAIEKYCKETGEKRTDVIIKGVAAYINFILPNPTTSLLTQQPAITEDRFFRLEETVTELIEKIKILEDSLHNKSVITSDNIDNVVENISIDSTPQNIEGDIIYDNDNDKLEKAQLNIEPKINGDNKYLEFKSITTVEAVEKTNFTRRQFDGFLRKAIQEAKNQSLITKPGELIKQPIELFHKNGIKVNNYPYKLFYIGQNSKGKPIWDLIPDDNNIYQPVITEFISYDTHVNNDSYQPDNIETFSNKESLKPLTKEPKSDDSKEEDNISDTVEAKLEDFNYESNISKIIEETNDNNF